MASHTKPPLGPLEKCPDCGRPAADMAKVVAPTSDNPDLTVLRCPCGWELPCGKLILEYEAVGK
jgi:hypothetical protein